MRDNLFYPNAKCINSQPRHRNRLCVAIFPDVLLVLVLPTWNGYNLEIARRQRPTLIGILSLCLM